MAVENDRILQKLMRELQQAKQNQHSQADMLKHIENIRLLCDLFLPAEDQPAGTTEEATKISDAELKAMIGESKSPNPPQQTTFKKSIELDDEEGTGDSIFDF
ncbi:YwdI family protein [Ornithinibacillus californiensis]|uniref:YwdI family protein n=1 Tax=Ornithinibacillus californiensis TaxID=161536 RepID=UPI00064DD8F2|nr:YwdI family protein [Ornithinibacillus californiensis]